MDAVYFWTGSSFTLLDYVSVLSTSRNTTFDTIHVFFDEDRPLPENAFWNGLDGIDRVRKQPAARRLSAYFEAYVGHPPSTVRYKRVVSDFFRYCHLYRHGGTWFDFDTLQVRDVRKLAEASDFVAGRERPDSVAIGVLSFPPRHVVLETLLKRSGDILNDLADQRVFRIGPPLFTQVVRQLGLEDQVLPERYFYPVPITARQGVILDEYSLPAETYSLHVWGSTNRRHFKGKTLDDFREVDSTYFRFARSLCNPSYPRIS